ncbi:polyhydroxyalkanoate synthesis repressor PhaR [Stenoxybacter acetivorans]|uniref:polyhydroxyalkanoate synthesis repressor PhaR n=1 Tax=Stenoxybacter acetivorans TaxID=422441 RepID=UPI00055ED335|nr:polyhydroxyalkanoate synthesis repressor PhaR [Stenoxybacter acetivorans]
MNAVKHVIKKYPNRRLYDTTRSAYITLADVRQMILAYVDVAVVDAKTDDDLTRQVLLQILLEEEAGSSPLFNDAVLCQLIRLYGHATQSLFAPFLEQNMHIFHEWQKSLGVDNANPAAWLAPFSFGTSANLFAEWQKQLQQQTLNFWQQSEKSDD